ncbi:hypothetical protein MKK68_14935 [Methylobacterium sp. E-016]|uniref:hypothetical protein n=1 Tax=Methylobacterium sp. E-016 TaxID=2836556 RepID=UPI001FB9A2EF|nr:hypothetical protein [Methylobacterium sp. E-016]MCJ2076930.1 hypothetical protein [Methylobacterium sp. E-016]
MHGLPSNEFSPVAIDIPAPAGCDVSLDRVQQRIRDADFRRRSDQSVLIALRSPSTTRIEHFAVY